MRNKTRFIGFMEAHDHDDASDGAWFQMLCDAGDERLKEFPEHRKDGNDMAHRYLRYTQRGEEKS